MRRQREREPFERERESPAPGRSPRASPQGRRGRCPPRAAAPPPPGRRRGGRRARGGTARARRGVRAAAATTRRAWLARIAAHAPPGRPAGIALHVRPCSLALLARADRALLLTRPRGSPRHPAAARRRPARPTPPTAPRRPRDPATAAAACAAPARRVEARRSAAAPKVSSAFLALRPFFFRPLRPPSSPSAVGDSSARPSFPPSAAAGRCRGAIAERRRAHARPRPRPPRPGGELAVGRQPAAGGEVGARLIPERLEAEAGDRRFRSAADGGAAGRRRPRPVLLRRRRRRRCCPGASPAGRRRRWAPRRTAS